MTIDVRENLLKIRLLLKDFKVKTNVCRCTGTLGHSSTYLGGPCETSFETGYVSLWGPKKHCVQNFSFQVRVETSFQSENGPKSETGSRELTYFYVFWLSYLFVSPEHR